MNNLPPLDFATHGTVGDSGDVALLETFPVERSLCSCPGRLSCDPAFGGTLAPDIGSDILGARVADFAGLELSGPDKRSSTISGRGRRETCFIHRSRHDWDVCRLFYSNVSSHIRRSSFIIYLLFQLFINFVSFNSQPFAFGLYHPIHEDTIIFRSERGSS